MKTTVEISDSLLRKARILAERNGLTLRAVLEDALRRHLDAQLMPRRKFRLRHHTFRGQGLQPGIASGSWSDLRSLIYEGRGG